MKKQCSVLANEKSDNKGISRIEEKGIQSGRRCDSSNIRQTFYNDLIRSVFSFVF